jgi:uncharacterized protein YuzE
LKFSYDPQEDVLYFQFKDGPSESVKEIENNVIVEFDDAGELMGIEFWNAEKLAVSSLDHLKNSGLWVQNYLNQAQLQQEFFRMFRAAPLLAVTIEMANRARFKLFCTQNCAPV